MDCDFKEFKPYKSLENFGESKALWYERCIDRDRRWINKEIKIELLHHQLQH